MLKTIINFIILISFFGCSIMQVTPQSYNHDVVQEMFTSKDKTIYTFVGDNFTYIFKDNPDDKHLIKKMNLMFQLIKNSNSWEFIGEPLIKKYLSNDENQTIKQKATILLSIQPTHEQIEFLNKIASNSEQTEDVGGTKLVKNFLDNQDLTMNFSENGRYVFFRFIYNNIIKIQTTPTIKKQFSKYLLSKPIEIKIATQIEDEEKTERHISWNTRIKDASYGLEVIILATVTLPIIGMIYLVKGNGK